MQHLCEVVTHSNDKNAVKIILNVAKGHTKEND